MIFDSIVIKFIEIIKKSLSFFVNKDKKAIYSLASYEIEQTQDGDFIITYNYESPAYFYNSYEDDYYEDVAMHSIVEKYTKNGELKNFSCKLSDEKEFFENGKEKSTYYRESDIKECLGKDKEDIISIVLDNNCLPKSTQLESGYIKKSFVFGIDLLFNEKDFLISAKIDNTKFKKISYYENDKKITIIIDADNQAFHYISGNIESVLENNYIKYLDISKNAERIGGCINVISEDYEVEFIQDGFYYLKPRQGKPELYSPSGMRIDKYPLVEKDKPDDSYGSVCSKNKDGSFTCTNINGLTTGGQLYNGVVYQYIYHIDGTYIKIYSDGDVRYYDNIAYPYNKDVKVTVESNADHSLLFKNGDIIKYNLKGEKI